MARPTAPRRPAAPTRATKPARPAATKRAAAAPPPPPPPLGSTDKSVQRHIAGKRAELRAIIRDVLALVQQAAPDATVDRMFGVLVCYVQRHRLCKIQTGLRKDCVHLVLDPDGVYPDPDELLLEHGWIGGCYLELRPDVELPRSTILGCLRADVRRIRRRRPAS